MPGHKTITGTLIVAKGATVTVFIDPCERALSMHGVVYKLALINIAVRPSQLSPSLPIACSKLTFVDSSIYPSINARTFW
jgi:hypothetical protein